MTQDDEIAALREENRALWNELRETQRLLRITGFLALESQKFSPTPREVEGGLLRVGRDIEQQFNEFF